MTKDSDLNRPSDSSASTFVPRLEVHRIHRYPKLRFDLADGMCFDQALRASHPHPSAAFNVERFLDNPDPMALFLKEVNARRCCLYWLGRHNGRNGAESIVATWEGFYVRFANIHGKYAQLRSMGTLTHAPKLPLRIQEVPTHMRHALAGWLRMKYAELGSLQATDGARPAPSIEGSEESAERLDTPSRPA